MSFHEVISSFPFVILFLVLAIEIASKLLSRNEGIVFFTGILFSIGAVFSIVTFVSGYWAHEAVGTVSPEVEEAIKFHHSVGRLVLFVVPLTFGIFLAKVTNPNFWLSLIYYCSLLGTLAVSIYISLLGKNLF